MVTPLGNGKEVFTEKLFRGDSGIRPLTAPDIGGNVSKMGAAVTDFTPRGFISAKHLRRMDRLSTMAVAAARLAVDDAGLSPHDSRPERVGVMLGVAFGGTDTAARFARTLFEEGPHRASPLLVPNTVMNAPAGHTAIELGLAGPNATVTHYEASAEIAIAYGAQEIRKGRADVMLVGGADAITPFFLKVLAHFRVLSPLNGGTEAARPFDRQRNGFIAGEGAGVVCLETLAHARHRGITPYCAVEGWGLCSQPTPPTGWPGDGDGMKRAMHGALSAARIDPDAVDFVSAAANGGRVLDRLEANALMNVFSSDSDRPLVSSIKGALGESFSSGGIRTAAAALCIQKDRVPPTLNLRHPIASLPFVTGSAIKSDVSVGLVNGFSSGGTFASLVLRDVDHR
jgi:3-oxoacyl-[acyl-carrier-protein] synthase II